MNSGCSESWPTAVCSGEAAPTVSAHQWSRPSCQSTSWPLRLTTTTFWTVWPDLAQGVVDRGLQGAGLAAAVGAVGGDHQFGFGVVDPGAEGVGGEAAEHHRVDGADPGAGQQRDDGLGNHGQVDGHAVTLGHAEGLEGVGGLLDLFGELGVRVGAAVAGFALEVDGHPVPEPVLHVPVQGVVGGVDLAADEPLGEGRVGPVQGLGEVLAPGEHFTGLPGPESGPVGVGLRIIRRGDHRVRGEVFRGSELPVLVGEVLEGVAVPGLAPVGRGPLLRLRSGGGLVGWHFGVGSSGRGAGCVLGHGEPHHSSIFAWRDPPSPCRSRAACAASGSG